jgi:hypothetical protein
MSRCSEYERKILDLDDKIDRLKEELRTGFPIIVNEEQRRAKRRLESQITMLDERREVTRGQLERSRRQGGC